MDADTANLRMKWIMAIESFVLDFLGNNGSNKSSGDLTRSLGGAGGDAGDDDDHGPTFSALSTQKLSPAEIEIMRTINKFTGCWMTDDEDNYKHVVTEGKSC